MLDSTYFAEVEEHTRPFRERRALDHKAKAEAHRTERGIILHRVAKACAELPTAREVEELLAQKATALDLLADLENDRDRPAWQRDIARRELRALASYEPPFAHPLDPALEPIWRDDIARHTSSEIWHKRRESGQRERFDRQDSCGVHTLVVACSDCGDSSEFPAGCNVGRLCVSCRGRQKARTQVRFGFARSRAIRARRALLNRRTFGGRWGERFVSLTVPHINYGELRTRPCDKCRAPSCPHHTPFEDIVAQRVDLAFRAWRFFSLALNRYWRRVEKHTGSRPVHHRAFEWTPGRDLKGHPHFHVWMFSPYLASKEHRAGVDMYTKAYRAWLTRRPVGRGVGSGPGAVARWRRAKPRRKQPNVEDMWRDALRSAGLLTVDCYADLMVDVRALPFDAREFARELFKKEDAIRLANFGERQTRFDYAPKEDKPAGRAAFDYASGWCLAEQEENGERIDARTFARVYESLEARRIIQASARFLDVQADGGYCEACGCVHSIRVTLKIEGFTHGPATERGPP